MSSVRKILIAAVAIAYAAAAPAQENPVPGGSPQGQSKPYMQAELQKLAEIGRKLPGERTDEDKKFMSDFQKKYQRHELLNRKGRPPVQDGAIAEPATTGGENLRQGDQKSNPGENANGSQ